MALHLSKPRSPPNSSASLLSPSSFPNRSFFDNQPRALIHSSPSEGKQLQHYFDSSAGAIDDLFVDTSNVPIHSIGDYMAGSYELQHPVHGLPLAGLQEGPDSLQMWAFAGGNLDGVASHVQSLNRSQPASSHTRTPSASTMASQATTASPIQSQRAVSHRPRGNDQPRPSNLSQGLARKQSSAGSLPTPSHTPIQDSFLAAANSNYNNMQDHSRRNSRSNINQTVSASMTMNDALNATADRMPAMSHSASNSFSSSGPQPTTPMAVVRERQDQGIKAGQHDYTQRPMVPKFERTLTDAYNDELYINTPMSVSAAGANPTSYLSPSHPVPAVSGPLSERLQAAQMARTSSSQSSQSLSPFRSESPWVHNLRPNSQMRQMEQPDLVDLSYQASPQTVSEPKTISPKEAMLDYKPEENEVPLFPPATTTYASQQSIIAPSSSAPQQFSGMAFNNMATTAGPTWNAALQSLNAPGFQSYQNFMMPSLPITGLPLDASFIANTGRQMDRNPEFPAHLTTMDSSASEAAPPSSMPSVPRDSPKPADSAAHTGTYSCTYHGCTERFSTPQKLQKHKRDTHRRNSNITPGVGSGMSSAQLAARNSQSGPHKCERINPTTGKPCNTIFSRPYDLTRHEDTIHNIRKQKVRCALCTEEKTFSRADALTRHLRVVHPEVDFPGKHRRRGGASP